MIVEIKFYVRKGALLDVALDAVNRSYHHPWQPYPGGHAPVPWRRHQIVPWHTLDWTICKSRRIEEPKREHQPNTNETTPECVCVVCFLDPCSCPGWFPGTSSGHERLWRVVCSSWWVSSLTAVLSWSCFPTFPTLQLHRCPLVPGRSEQSFKGSYLVPPLSSNFLCHAICVSDVPHTLSEYKKPNGLCPRGVSCWLAWT